MLERLDVAEPGWEGVVGDALQERGWPRFDLPAHPQAAWEAAWGLLTDASAAALLEQLAREALPLVERAGVDELTRLTVTALDGGELARQRMYQLRLRVPASAKPVVSAVIALRDGQARATPRQLARRLVDAVAEAAHEDAGTRGVRAEARRAAVAAQLRRVLAAALAQGAPPEGWQAPRPRDWTPPSELLRERRVLVHRQRSSGELVAVAIGQLARRPSYQVSLESRWLAAECAGEVGEAVVELLECSRRLLCWIDDLALWSPGDAASRAARDRHPRAGYDRRRWSSVEVEHRLGNKSWRVMPRDDADQARRVPQADGVGALAVVVGELLDARRFRRQP